MKTQHPGEVIKEYLEFYGWTQRDIAQHTGLTPKIIDKICNGKESITEQIALELEKIFQRPSHFWLNLQKNFNDRGAAE